MIWFVSESKIRTFLRCFLIILIIATLSFTFFQSSKNKEDSNETSENFGEIIEPIIPSDTPVGDYVHSNIRKIAHFIEFLALGTEIALYIVVFHAKLKIAAFSLLAAPVLALIDETIQIFSDRGPSIADVWLDVSGYFAGALLTYAVGFLILKFCRANSSADSIT